MPRTFMPYTAQLIVLYAFCLQRSQIQHVRKPSYQVPCWSKSQEHDRYKSKESGNCVTEIISFASNYGYALDVTKAETIWSVIVAILFVGAIVGSLSLELVGEKLGRKRGMYLSFTITAIAVATSMVSFFINSFELYSASRVLTGYSPKECRGFVCMMMGVMVQFGTVIGSILAMPSVFGTVNGWWLIYLVECIIVLFVLLALPLMPESPGYLTLCGDEAAARKSILFFRCYKLDEVDAVLHEIKENLMQNAKALSYGIKDKLVKERSLEWLFPYRWHLAELPLAIVASSFTVDRYGRRPLILITNCAILLLNVTIVLLMYCFNKFHVSYSYSFWPRCSSRR
uniref:Major facilitator superfamily (MFS) profile domain-containing protein n=1 Tax=Parascaris equorum TaxID=6256 RepID=A0A914RQL8_PAREQ